MKTKLTVAFALLLATFVLLVPVRAATDSASTSDSDNARIKALEAELAALRAQLRAESGIRNEDRGRDRNMAERRERERRAQEAARREHERRMHEHHEHHGEGDHEHSEHRVMHFDLHEMTGGDIQGEVHIEIDGSMDAMPGFLPELIMRQMDGHFGDIPMLGDAFREQDDEMMHEQEMLEALHMHVVAIMEEHGMPMELLDEVSMAMEAKGIHPIEAVHLLIERLDEEGFDPAPLIELMEEVHGDHDGGHHDEDPFFRQGGEFVAKMELAKEIGVTLSDPLDVAIFGVWEARQHLEPEERLQVLGPIMGDENIDMSVRNAAAMVVREAFYQLGDREKALETLHLQIRLNGTVR